MADEEKIARIERAIVAELKRQGERHGIAVDDNGEWAQVDGGFKLRPLALAVLAAISQP